MYPMSAPLDIDQLQTFVAIVDTGSFTKAAGRVFKTQSAVSMQMRRLEDRVGKPIFSRDGRQSRLTEDGRRLLEYARRLIRLNDETLAAFDYRWAMRQAGAGSRHFLESALASRGFSVDDCSAVAEARTEL